MNSKLALVFAAAAATASQVALAQTPPASVGIEAAPEEAQAPAQAQGPRIVLGGLVGFAPDYEGSNNYEFAAAPLASIRWAQGYGVSLGPSTMRSYQLRADLLPSRNWSFGPLLQARPGRDGVDDPRVDNLSDIDRAWEAGAHFGYRLGIDPNNPATTLGINIQAAADISDESNGWLMQPGLDYITRFSPQWLFNARLFSTYADQNYMQEYFGIGASNVRDSGLSFYNADAGFKDVGLRVAADYLFSERWSVGGGVQYIRLIGDAEDSPVTKRGSEDQFFGGVSLSYRF
jgi:outer membrane scaffolding protein for murein synthesis (MipA/OmpV family)